MDSAELAQWLVESAFSYWASGDFNTTHESLVGDKGMSAEEASALIQKYDEEIKGLLSYMEKMGLRQAESLVKYAKK